MDFSIPTGLIKTGTLARIRADPGPVDELIFMRKLLGERQLQAFKRRYGDILELLCIPVQLAAIKTLSQYWDNSLRCFVLPHCHLTLALEEYAALMRMPVHEKTLVYSYHLPSQIQVAALLGLSHEQVEYEKQGEATRIPLKFLISHMTKLSKEKDWPRFNKVLALSIYGAVLFPSKRGAVDLAAIGVFLAVEYQNINPVPAILADTILSLTYCLGKGGGQLWCCLQLLTVWLGNHVFGKEWSRGIRLDQVHHPLRDFNEREGKIMKDSLGGSAPATPQDWVSFFKELTSQNIKWKLAWWDHDEVLYSCGDFPNVPLVGARGGVNYNPSIAFKQLAFEQRVPPLESLQPFLFFHDDQAVGWNERITHAWKRMDFKGRTELGVRQIHATAEFEKWMHGPKGERQPPVTPSPNPLMGKRDEKMKGALDALINQQKETIENMRAEKKRQRKEIKKNEEEYVLLHRDLRNLRRKGGWASTSQEREHEMKQVKVELTASKRREQETQRRWEGEQRKNMELRAKVRLERERASEALKEIKELAAHLEQEKGASDILQKEIEDMADTHIEKVEELVLSRAEFQLENHELRKRLGQIAQWVNKAVPTFSNVFYRADDSMKPFYTTPQLQDFLDLSRALIEDWDELRRSPV